MEYGGNIALIKQNQKHLNKLFVFVDALVIFLAINLSYYIRFGYNGFSTNDNFFNFYILPLILMIPIYLVLFSIFDLYEPYRFKSIISEAVNIIKCNILGVVIFMVLLYLLKRVNYSRLLILVFFLSSICLICIERISLRMILRSIRKRGYNVKHVLFIGINDETYNLVREIEQNKQWGYVIEGILCNENFKEAFQEVAAESASKGSIADKIKIIDDLSVLETYISGSNIDEVFITLSFNEHDKINKIIHICEKCGTKCQLPLDFSDSSFSKPYIEEIGNIPVMGVRYIPLDNLFNNMVKRTFDIILSSIAIILSSPIMLASVIIIKLTSPGPIIFKQKRVGLNKKVFTMYKFRSMNVQKASDEKVEWTTENDPRKTKFGSFMRKTSIDELPQFFNVLKGDMSMIGPRPERPYFVDKFKHEIPKYMVKHQVRPGITGWAQVNGWRGDTSIDKRIQCDVFYIENWSFFLDIKIVFLTFFKGFVNKNAY